MLSARLFSTIEWEAQIPRFPHFQEKSKRFRFGNHMTVKHVGFRIAGVDMLWSVVISCLLVVQFVVVESRGNGLPDFVLDFNQPAGVRYNSVWNHFRDTIIVMENDMMHEIAPVYRELVQNNTDKVWPLILAK